MNKSVILKKNPNMKTYYSLRTAIFFTAVLLLFVNCTNEDNNEISYDLTGNWRVVYFMDGDEKVTKAEANTWPDVNNGDITTNFTEPDSDGQGTISGITVTNAFNGSYTIEDQGELFIGPVATTFINEPEWTALFRLGGNHNYEIRNATLFIYYNNGNNTIAFERN